MINDLTNDLIFDLEFPVYTIENNYSYNYWWDHVEGIRIGGVG